MTENKELVELVINNFISSADNLTLELEKVLLKSIKDVSKDCYLEVSCNHTDNVSEKLRNNQYLKQYICDKLTNKYPDFIISIDEKTIDIHLKYNIFTQLTKILK